MEGTFTGKCHCGQIAYEAQGPIEHQGACTFRACQRTTGALASPYLAIDAKNFRIPQGRPKAYSPGTGEGCEAGTFHFCDNCGSPLYWTTRDDDDFLAIFVGTLDATGIYKATEKLKPLTELLPSPIARRLLRAWRGEGESCGDLLNGLTVKLPRLLESRDLTSTQCTIPFGVSSRTKRQLPRVLQSFLPGSNPRSSRSHRPLRGCA